MPWTTTHGVKNFWTFSPHYLEWVIRFRENGLPRLTDLGWEPALYRLSECDPGEGGEKRDLTVESSVRISAFKHSARDALQSVI